MHIDWLTVIAQIFNFLLLVWLLKKYLYHPIIDAMDKREQRIANEMEAADQREQDAEECIDLYKKKLLELDKSRSKLMEEAKNAAADERIQLIWQASIEATEKRASWNREIAREQQDFLHSLTETASQSVIDIIRRALSELAGQTLETQIINTFIEKLHQLDETSLNQIRQSKDEIRVSTSFSLDEQTRTRLGQSLKEDLGIKADIHFSESAELISGIELIASSQRIAWSISDYLQSLEQRLRLELEDNLMPVKNTAVG